MHEKTSMKNLWSYLIGNELNGLCLMYDHIMITDNSLMLTFFHMVFKDLLVHLFDKSNLTYEDL